MNVQKVIDAQNAVVDETMQVTMGGVGVGYGQVQETGHLFSGTAFFETFALGEDVSEKREVLVTKALKEAVEGNPSVAGVVFEQRTHEEFHDGARAFFRVEGLPEQTFKANTQRLMAITDVNEVADSVGYSSKPTSVKHFVHQLLNRFTVSGDLRAAIDRTIEAEYMRDVAVLMYGAAWDAVAEKEGTDKMEELQKEANCTINKIVAERYGGEVVEDMLFVFPSAAEAVAAAIALRQTFREGGKVPFTGFGVHVGKVLYARHTDVHWGDPVNTASKLGQDFSKQGEVVVSDIAWQEAKEKSSEIKGEVEKAILDAEATLLEGIRISGVEFKAFAIS